MAKADKAQKKTTARIRSEEAKRARAALEGGGATSAGVARLIAPKAKYERRQTGLLALRNKAKISDVQLQAGERYGALYRDAALEGDAMIKSALGSLDEPRGSGFGGRLPDLLPADYIVSVRRQLHDARIDGLRSQATLIAACDVICGKQWTSQMVTPDRSDQLQIETSLRIALDLLTSFFRAGAGQTAAESVAA